MTCHDVCERLSALLDGAFGPAERQPIEAHLAACAECRRELEALRATVRLLGRVPAARAPAGFVDRVMAATHRPPWPRRVLDALFIPFRVKLPLEAAAVVLVSVSALYVYQRTPEVREWDRQPTRETAPALPVAPPAPSTSPAPSVVPPAPSPTPAPPGPSTSSAPPAAPETAAKAPGGKAGAIEAPRVPAPSSAAREEARQTAPAVTAPAPSTAPSELRDAPAVSSRPPAALGQKEQEASADLRADAPARASSSAASDTLPKSAEPASPSDATGQRSNVAQSKRSSPEAVPSPQPEEPSGGSASRSVVPSSPSAPPAERPVGESAASAKAPVARRLMRAVDASGRLVVAAREPAETALDALLGRLGGRRVERRLEGDRGLVIIDVLVPGARYRELIEGLGGIGRWVTEHEPRALPAQLRVEVALTVEP